MADLSSLSQLTNSATALANLILVSPQSAVGYQPMNPPNPDGTKSTAAPPKALLFNYEGEQSVSLQSDVTDHYVEDNTALQDQISLKPEEISTHGFIGELNDVAEGALAPIQTVANKLTAIGSYAPALSTTALLAYNNAFQLYQVAQNAINSGVSAWSSITGQGGTSVISSAGISKQQPNQTKQQLMFQQFYGYWRNRTLFTVQTPWAIFENMVIKSLRAVQDATTNVITDFEVTFKMMRFATTDLVDFNSSNTQGRLSVMSSSVTEFGSLTPVSSISVNSALSSKFPSLGVVG